MRFFRDDALLRRAIGAAMVFGLLGLWARHWREEIASRGTYATDTYDAANNLAHTCWTFAIVLLVYVSASLLLTPRGTTREAAETLAPRVPPRP